METTKEIKQKFKESVEAAIRLNEISVPRSFLFMVYNNFEHFLNKQMRELIESCPERIPTGLCSKHQTPVILCDICYMDIDTIRQWKQDKLKELNND